MNKLFNAGIYVRLSLEDVKNHSKAKAHIASGDSISIENPKEILTNHAEKMGWFVKKVYSDDGYSGGTFDRPAFKEMLEDVKSGKMIGGFSPYGYQKSTDESQQLLIDEYAAEVVRRIFELRLTSMGYAKIAGILNSNGILSPRAYRYQNNGKENPYKGEPIWLVKMIKTILKSEYYIEHTIQMKTGSVSYRTKQVKPRAKEERLCKKKISSAC